MSVNAISNNNVTATVASTVGVPKEVKDKEAKTTKDSKDTAVVYEKSSSDTKKTYTQDTNLIAKLKADAEQRTSQFKNLVEQLLTKQNKTFQTATDFFQALQRGEIEVDAATKAQAQEDVSEDGYWGVKQTSERILDFAKALTGGDPSKIDEMKAAFEKGFKAAEKLWGGELPEISQKTYDAVMKGFEEWKNPSTEDTDAAQ
ncbi:MAG: hypothetical protein U0L23_02160 [Lachnospiraceae bacterium]|nr:hypothetical protein [Lachnospiraceae bacterium]MEE1341498.1 hypothetical protein [Lachnospiraceae bacterium]